jgi:FdhE protein
VVETFLHKWLGDPQDSPAVEDARAELDRLAAARPDLGPLVRWLRELLPDLAPGSSAPAVPLEPQRARAKLIEGIPLLRGEQVAIDAKAFRQRWRRACGALESQQADGAAAALADAMRGGRLDPAAMADAVVAGRPEVVRERAEELRLDPGLATTLLRFTLFPLFTALEASLGPLRAGVVWERGYCPTCGSWPLLGEFRGLEQTRFLRCGLCASGWEAARLWCPFCGNRDHEQLGFLHCEGEETRYRSSVCDGCRGYVKMVSTLSALSPLHLLVVDVATLHLDLAAAQRGYTSHF